MSDQPRLCLAVVLIFFGLLTPAAFAADDWSPVRRQALGTYADSPAELRAPLSEAEREGVPAGQVSSLLGPSKAASVSAGDFGAFVSRLVIARKEGFPVHRFTEKILEGLSKDVPPDRIFPVLDRQLQTYREAQAITRAVGKEGGPSLEAVSLAMERGVSPRILRVLLESTLPVAEVVMYSSQALADLKDLGFSEPQALRIVQAGILAGSFTRSEPFLLAALSRSVKAGRSREEIADAVERGFRRGDTVSRISQRLQGVALPSTFGGMRMQGVNGGGGSGGTSGGGGNLGGPRNGSGGGGGHGGRP